jgi:hypothetical protein
VHVHKNPPLLGTLTTTLGGSLDVSIHAFALQGRADTIEDGFGVSGRRVIIPEKAGIQRDSQSALTQHYKATKSRNGIGVMVN